MEKNDAKVPDKPLIDSWESDQARLDQLSAILKDRTQSVELRSAAARELGPYQCIEALEPLIAALLVVDEHPSVLLGIAEGLREVFDETDFLANEWEDIAKVVESVPLDRLIALAVDRQLHSEVRTEVVSLLHYIEDERIKDALLPILADKNENPALRSEVAMTIHNYPDDVIWEVLLSILQDENEPSELRHMAASLLGYLGKPEAVEPLLAVIRTGVNDPETLRLRHSAIMSLDKLGDRRALDPLIEALVTGEPLIQAAASVALRNLGVTYADEPLLASLPNAQRHFDESIISAWEKLKDSSVINNQVKEAIDLLQDKLSE